MGKVGQTLWMKNQREGYPTDLNDTQWRLIEQYFPKEAATGRPQKHGWREIVNAISYVAKNGCVWRAMPHDLPPWKTVYHYFRSWQQSGLWEEMNAGLRRQVRVNQGREAEASGMVIDSQTARSAEGGPERGYDGGKKVSGRKRNLVVDTLGLVVHATVTAANVQDRYAGEQLLEELKARPELWVRLAKIWADGGYRGGLVDWTETHLKADLEIVLVDRAKKGFQVLAKRWVVERTFAWLTRYRRLARDYERSAASSQAFIFIAMSRLALQRLAPF